MLFDARDPLLMVHSSQIFRAVEKMPRLGTRELLNGVHATKSQLLKAAETLRDGPQPIANGIKAEMPGFIDREAQDDPHILTFQVGILPSRIYRIRRDGSVAADEPSDALDYCDIVTDSGHSSSHGLVSHP